jgi:hypothetical protein
VLVSLSFGVNESVFHSADTDMSDTPPAPERSNEGILRSVVRDAVSNTVYFGIGTFAVIFIGRYSWSIGVVLAGIEALLATIQSFRVLFILGADLALFILALSGTPRREANEAEIRWASLVRVVELGIWMGCLFILYRFFFG